MFYVVEVDELVKGEVELLLARYEGSSWWPQLITFLYQFQRRDHFNINAKQLQYAT